MNENETPEPVDEEEVQEAPKPETAVEEEADAAPMTLDDIVEKVAGIVNNFRAKGVTAVTRRLFAGLEGFFDGASGDDEKKPPRKG